MAILTSSQQTFVDITDQRKLSAYITSNLPKSQIEDPNVLPPYLCAGLGQHTPDPYPGGISRPDQPGAGRIGAYDFVETEGGERSGGGADLRGECL